MSKNSVDKNLEGKRDYSVVKGFLQAATIAGMITAAMVAAVVLLVRLRRRWAQRLREAMRPLPSSIPVEIRGLTEAQAQTLRQEGQDNVVDFQPQRTLKVIVRENMYTIFNLSLVGIAGVQFLLAQWFDGFISLGVAALSVGLNVGQEMLAMRMLRDVEQSARPRATVIREGRVRSIDPSEIVRGDVLAVGTGDQFLVDGEVLGEGVIQVDEYMLTGKVGYVTKSAGDPVYAGSNCVSGRAAYLAQKVGDERLISSLVSDIKEIKKTLTPLERIINRVLSIFLIAVVILTVVLLSRYFTLSKTTVVNVETVISISTVIFSLAPASLYFMIFLTYSSGSAQLARKGGALVNRARSIEYLAYATSLCATSESARTTTNVDVEILHQPGNEDQIAQSRLRQILGDFARNSSSHSPAVKSMENVFQGERRRIVEEAPFLTVYGWSAVSFDDEDLRGVYVLGEPLVLERNLVVEEIQEPDVVEEKRSHLTSLRNRFSSVRQFFLRLKDSDEEEETQIQPREQAVPLNHHSQGDQDVDQEPGNEESSTRWNPVRKLMNRIRRDEEPGQKTAAEESAQEEDGPEETIFLFAYLPASVALYDINGMPQLPEGIIPLCRLHYTEQLKPETIDMLKGLVDTGLSLRIFSHEKQERIIELFRKLKPDQNVNDAPRVIFGSELEELSPEEFSQAVVENHIFQYVTPEQEAELIQVLRGMGETVVSVCDGPNDLEFLRNANLSIAWQSSSQAVLGVADIILLKDSPKALLKVLDQGQAIVNGLLDVLRLYLSQLSYLLILIILFASFGLGFPYLSQQGSFIAIATLALPSLGFSLWDVPGRLKSSRMSALLTRFVIPAALAISLAGSLVYIVILNRTGESAYAQLVLTYMLVFSGLLLVIFVRPPVHLRIGGTNQKLDWRPTILVLVIVILFLIVASMPLAYDFFRLTHLRELQDYLIAIIGVLAWGLFVQILWFFIPPNRPREESLPAESESAFGAAVVGSRTSVLEDESQAGENGNEIPESMVVLVETRDSRME